MKFHYIICILLWSNCVLSMEKNLAKLPTKSPIKKAETVALSDELTQKLKAIYRAYEIDTTTFKFFVKYDDEMAPVSKDDEGIKKYLITTHKGSTFTMYMSPLFEHFLGLADVTTSSTSISMSVNSMVLFYFLQAFEYFNVSKNKGEKRKQAATMQVIKRMSSDALTILKEDAKLFVPQEVGFESHEAFLHYIEIEKQQRQ